MCILCDVYKNQYELVSQITCTCRGQTYIVIMNVESAREDTYIAPVYIYIHPTTFYTIARVFLCTLSCWILNKSLSLCCWILRARENPLKKIKRGDGVEDDDDDDKEEEERSCCCCSNEEENEEKYESRKEEEVR